MNIDTKDIPEVKARKIVAHSDRTRYLWYGEPIYQCCLVLIVLALVWAAFVLL